MLGRYLADSQHFGMGGGIAQFLRAVPGGGNDAPGGGSHQYAAHRHLATPRGFLSLSYGLVHMGVGLIHSSKGGSPSRFRQGPLPNSPSRLTLQHMSTHPPTVGITLDWEKGNGYAKQSCYALHENYAACVTSAGGLPLMLPHEPQLAEECAARVDALIITGGDFDVDPALFGETTHHPKVTTKDHRTRFEFEVTKTALERDIPVLGICGGQQLLNVVLGGTLIQHIPDEVDSPLAHEQPNPRTEPGHEVVVTPGTLLHRIVDSNTMAVNSAHHQAVKNTGSNVVVNAAASDGIIEGIESTIHNFCLGVQWHPEFAIDPGDKKIFEAFVAVAQK